MQRVCADSFAVVFVQLGQPTPHLNVVEYNCVADGVRVIAIFLGDTEAGKHLCLLRSLQRVLLLQKKVMILLFVGASDTFFGSGG